MTSAELLFACLRYSVCGTELREAEKSALSGPSLVTLYQLAASHDLAHLVCDALQKNDLLPQDKIGQAFRKQKDLAVYRYIQQSAAFEEISRLFEEAGIVYVPLKGIVIRQYYPEPWMRTSCDLDILVHEEDLERAAALAVERLGYKREGQRGYHDISLYSPAGVHLELHFQIEGRAEELDAVLAQVWENVQPVSGRISHNTMDGAFFMFYHLAHMSHHFITGGCGLRAFIDCYLLMEKLPYDQQHLEAFLETGDIRKFSDAVFSYAATWMGREAFRGSEIDSSVQKYILNGGMYGTLENVIPVQQVRRGGRARNIFNRVWLPYKELQVGYGAPPGRKYLIPFFQIKRWGQLIFKKKRLGYGAKEIMRNVTAPDADRSEMAQILHHLGLTER